jgi:thiol-disulfide isomerase/thioredoxin
MLRQWFVPLGVSLLSVVAGVLVYNVVIHQPEYQSAPPPVPASSTQATQNILLGDIRLTDLEGRAHSLDQWQEPVLIVNFWAPWCAPCRREIPALINAQESAPTQLHIIGVAFDSLANVQDFIAKQPVNYPILLAGEHTATLNRFFGNSSGGLPFTAFLNPQRDIIHRHTGEIDSSQIERWTASAGEPN